MASESEREAMREAGRESERERERQREAGQKAIEAAHWESYLISWALALQDYTHHTNDKCNDDFCYCGLKDVHTNVAKGCQQVLELHTHSEMVVQIDLSADDATIPYHQRADAIDVPDMSGYGTETVQRT